MPKFAVGDKVRTVTSDAEYAGYEGVIAELDSDHNGYRVAIPRIQGTTFYAEDELHAVSETTAIDPNHYKFGDVEVRQISGHLTSFGGQALQYIARATRLDGANKGDAIEDLKKSLRFIQWEIERLEGK